LAAAWKPAPICSRHLLPVTLPASCSADRNRAFAGSHQSSAPARSALPLAPQTAHTAANLVPQAQNPPRELPPKPLGTLAAILPNQSTSPACLDAAISSHPIVCLYFSSIGSTVHPQHGQEHPFLQDPLSWMPIGVLSTLDMRNRCRKRPGEIASW